MTEDIFHFELTSLTELEIINFNSIKSLSISVCLTKQASENLSKALTENNTLSYLSFENFYLEDGDMLSIILLGLKSNKSIKSLYFYRVDGNVDALQYLASALEKNTSIEELEFVESYTLEDCTKYLEKALYINKTLKTFIVEDNISGDNIRTKKLSYVSNILKNNKTLENLMMNIDWDNIDINECKEFAEAIVINNTLVCIHFGYNIECTDNSKKLQIIVNALKINKTLRFIYSEWDYDGLNDGFDNGFDNEISLRNNKLLGFDKPFVSEFVKRF